MSADDEQVETPDVTYHSSAPIDPELLEILVCPKTKSALELVELPLELQQSLADKYQEYFTDEEQAEVTHALLCAESELVYPIVSQIPIMLVDEALPASVIER